MGRRRPFVFSRWGGLGNHRYPIGFSGDTVIHWGSLAFQPYFTSTAANVAYGWWSHDIGGHFYEDGTPELYLRWVQFGVFSPIFRLHSTNKPALDRRPWSKPERIYHAARDAMQLRHALIPYIYSMAWRAHQTGYQSRHADVLWEYGFCRCLQGERSIFLWLRVARRAGAETGQRQDRACHTKGLVPRWELVQLL